MLPDLPDAGTRDHLLDVLAGLVARGGAASLLAAPVEPGPAAFPDAWAPSASGVALLLRRLAWYAGLDRAIEIDNQLAGAPPTERKPATSVELTEVDARRALFVARFIGDDDVAGTLAHEIGVAYAALHRPDRDPYRAAGNATITIDPELDLERGSIATVYLGLGVLAANAARQHHSVVERQGFNPLLVATVGAVVEAGHATMDALAYLVAVQAVVRGSARPPAGLESEQRGAVEAWIAALRERASELRERLGVAADAEPSERLAVKPFADAPEVTDEKPAATAFRWRTHRGGVGTIAGTVLGIGLGVGLSIVSAGALAGLVLGGAVGGHLIGRRVRVPRCSACATVVPAGAPKCTRCGATLRGEIGSLSERLEAEERLGGHDSA